MKKLLVSASVTAAAVLAFAAVGNDDPVLMTVNGKPVHKSEFEYLYHKNNSQQLQPQTIDEYLQMFIDYKLKVADAEAAGLDTTASFRTEYNNYRDELAGPYLTDSTVMSELLEEAYRHMLEDVKVAHIMLPLSHNAQENTATLALADSLYNVVSNGDENTWNEIAQKYSVDRGTSLKGGLMGWLPVNRFPWPFEKAAYDTPVGKISKPVNSGYGFHLVKPVARRASRGEVKAQHILKLTRGLTPAQADSVKAVVDSIYNVVKAGADFSDVARRESQDPGSAQRGGELDWFGSGIMVAEFDSVAFALPESAISEPFATAYGYHIVKNLGHRPVASFEDLKGTLSAAVTNDERGLQPRSSFIAGLLKDFNGKVLEDGLDEVKELIQNNGGYDSVALAQLEVSNIPVFEIAGKQYPVSSVMPTVASTASKDAANARMLIATATRNALEKQAVEMQKDRMLVSNPEYRNLVNEYRDGILLFDISNLNVWEKASKDKSGLENYFKQNRAKYQWEKPKYKSFIVFAATDSVMQQAKQYVDSLGSNYDADNFVTNMRDRFGRNVRVERVMAGEGDNVISDYLFFNGPKPELDKLTWQYFFPVGQRLVEQPEEAIDVRGAVTTDYQNKLEQEWLKQLRKKYKVKIDKKVKATLK